MSCEFIDGFGLDIKKLYFECDILRVIDLGNRGLEIDEASKSRDGNFLIENGI